MHIVSLARIMAHRYFDTLVDPLQLDEDIFPILQVLRPQWTKEDLCKDSFENGFINSMVCFYQKSDDKRTDGLVVRIYGTTVNISREKEILSLQIAHAAGCFPAVLATFKNGLVYPYVQGRMATFTDLTQPPVIKELTRLIYNLQHTNPQELDLFDRQGNRTEFKKFETTLGPIKRCLARIPNKATDSAMDEVFQQIRKELTDDVLREEFGFLEKFYNGFPEPIVLCHNDLQPWNILINDETGELTILDYELTSRNLDMHDFARLWDKRIFYEVLGFCDKDEPVFNDDIKRLYFQGYLEAKRMNGTQILSCWTPRHVFLTSCMAFVISS